jgi:hypothetical protein
MMTDVRLVQLVYHSRRTPGTTDEVVVDHVALLSAAKNRLLGITGRLWYGPTRFVQVIEGPPDAVDAVFESIGRDFRHSDVRCCCRGEIATRTFDSWTFVAMEGDEREAVEGILQRYGVEPDALAKVEPRTVIGRVGHLEGVQRDSPCPPNGAQRRA